MSTLGAISVLRRTTLMSLLLISTIGDFKGNRYTLDALERTFMTIVLTSSVGTSR